MPRTVMLELVDRVIRALGAEAEVAASVSDHLVNAEACGVRTHGVARVSQYEREVLVGQIVPTAVPTVVEETDARVLLDGNRAFGPFACRIAATHVARMADDLGIGLVTVRQCGHAGRIGAYVENLARAGKLALAWCSGPRDGHRVAPFGGLDGRLATNPIAYAFPAQEHPVVGDFATSATTEGFVRMHARQRDALPAGLLQDDRGTDTLDPSALYDDPAATIVAFGGRSAGHKGTAMALLVEVMATTLADEDTTDPNRVGNNVTILALAVSDRFASRATRLVDYVRSSRPAPGVAQVNVPGDVEYRAQEHATSMLRMSAATLRDLRDVVHRCGVPWTLAPI